MLKNIFLFFIFSVSLFSQENTVNTVVTETLKEFKKDVRSKNWDDARHFFLNENVSDEQMTTLAEVIGKVQLYINDGIITPKSEGSRLISIPLRQSVIYLHKVDDGWRFTDGTLTNLEDLQNMASLLNTPIKSMEYFVEQVDLFNIQEASSCFVLSEGEVIEKEKLEKFSEVIKYLLNKKAAGKYQGKGEDASLVSYSVDSREIALVKQNYDWLFTVNTRDNLLNISAEYRSSHVVIAAPTPLNDTIFLMKNWQWMGVIGILIVGVIAQWFLQLTFRKTILSRIQDKLTESQQNPKFVSVTLLSMGLSWFLLLPMLNLDPEVFSILRNGSALLTMISAIFVISRALDIIKNVLLAKAHKTDNKVDDVLIPMFHKVIKLAVFVIGIILIASNIGINVGSLLAGLGIAGMAFALAAKDTVENIFGSVTVLTDKPFEVGDWVVINGVEGTVEQIGLRSTRIRTFYCSQVNVPNSTLIKAVVDNYGRRTYRRIKTYLSLTYDTPAEKIEAFCEGIRELIRNHPHTRKDYYQVYFNQFNSASLDVLLYCYIDTQDWAIELREKQRLFLDIKRLAARLEVEFAFPTQTIHMANSEDLYPPVKETSLDAITAAYEAGKKDAAQIIQETANTSKTSFPKAINYDKGTPYVETGK